MYTLTYSDAQIFARLGAVAIRHLQADALALNSAFHRQGMRVMVASCECARLGNVGEQHGMERGGYCQSAGEGWH
jgi:hypothetical protein